MSNHSVVMKCEKCNSEKLNLTYHPRWTGNYEIEKFYEMVASYLCSDCGYFGQFLMNKETE